jgi:hypothetical protein
MVGEFPGLSSLAKALPVFVPFVCGHLPYFGGQCAGDEVALFGGDDAHAGLLRDASGGEISDRLGGAKDGESEDIEPEVIYGADGLGHKALAVPWQAEPEAAIIGLALDERDGSDVVLGGLLESQRPVPFVAALDGGERCVAVVGESSVGGVGPGDDGVQQPDDLPVGKEALGLGRVGELEGAQDETLRVKFDGRDAGRHGGTITAEEIWTE